MSASSDLPLDETALQAAIKAWQETPSSPSTPGFESAREQFNVAFRNAISTYLREARFETQIDDASKHGYDGPKTHRLVGPWVPVVQAESKEE